LIVYDARRTGSNQMPREGKKTKRYTHKFPRSKWAAAIHKRIGKKFSIDLQTFENARPAHPLAEQCRHLQSHQRKGELSFGFPSRRHRDPPKRSLHRAAICRKIIWEFSAHSGSTRKSKGDCPKLIPESRALSETVRTPLICISSTP